MSVRGLEIHNGYMAIPQVTELAAGTPSTTLDQSGVNAIEVGVGKTIKAASGVEKAFDAYLVTGIAGAESLVGVHVDITGATALAVTGYAYGVEVSINVLGTGQLGSDGYDINGVRVGIYAEAGVTLPGHIMGIFISNYILKQPSPGSYFMIWLQENGSVTIQAWIHCHQGGTSNSNYWLSITGVSDAWASAGDKTGGGVSGWLKVNTPGGARYIQLYA